jgi:transcriptional regulator
MNPGRFAARDEGDVVNLVTRHPLAFLVSAAGERMHATPLPMRIERLADGRIASLSGHIARANPQVPALRANPRATLLFLGAQAYVSPSWLNDRTQSPTWNYACVNFSARIEFLDDAASIEHIVRDLVDAMEAGRQRAWSVDEMHARYAQLATRIVAFRANVTACDCSGQTECRRLVSMARISCRRRWRGSLRGRH